MVVYMDTRFPLADRLRVVDAVALVRVVGVVDTKHRDVVGEDGVGRELLTVELELVELLRGDVTEKPIMVPLLRDPHVEDALAHLGGAGAELVALLQRDHRFGAAIDTGLRLVAGERLEPLSLDDEEAYTTVTDVRAMLERIAEDERRERAELDEAEPGYARLKPRRLVEVAPTTARGRARLAKAIALAEELSAATLGDEITIPDAEAAEVTRRPR